MKIIHVALASVIAVALGIAAVVDSDSVNDTVSADYVLVADNPRKERRDDRQEDRPERRDDRQDCRGEEGLAGKDKRDCKQGERGGDDDVEADANNA